MKLFEVNFKPMWPVPSGLIIKAKDIGQAYRLAVQTVTHTRVERSDIKEIELSDDAQVIFYEPGDY